MSELAIVSRRNLSEVPSSSTGTVLIIDDEAEIRESLQTLLELEGYDVEAAGSGEEGLARVEERPFDLVLLDLALPDRNGMEVLAHLRAHDAQLCIIMITAYGTVENAAPPEKLQSLAPERASKAKMLPVPVLTKTTPSATAAPFPPPPPYLQSRLPVEAFSARTSPEPTR